MAALLQAGAVTIAQIVAAIKSVRGVTDQDTEAADNAALEALAAYITAKHGEAAKLAEFGQ